MKKKSLFTPKGNYFAPRDNGRKFQDEVPTKEGNLTFPSREGGYGVSRRRMSFIGASTLSFTLILLSLFTLNYSSIFNLSSPTVHAADASADTDTVDSTSSAQLSIAVPTSIALSITSTRGDSTCDDASTNTLCLKWSDDGKKATGSQAILVQTNNPTGYTVTVDNGDGMLHPLGSSNASTNTTTIPFAYSAQEADKGKVKTTTMNSTANQITYDWTATPNKPNYLTKMDSYSQKVVYYATANDAGANIVYPSTRRIYNFAYTGAVQTFTAPYDGKYKVEAWGASGGFNDNTLVEDTGLPHGGYGGYSVGSLALSKGSQLYVTVGNHGAKYFDGDSDDTRFNGGGVGGANGAAGGGATSIQSSLASDGQLKNYESSKDKVLIVAGGGGGNDWTINQSGNTSFGDAGGYIGNYGTNGTISGDVRSVFSGAKTACPGGQDETANCNTWRLIVGDVDWSGVLTKPGFGYGGGSPAVYDDSGEMTSEAGGAGGGGWYGGYPELWGIGGGGSGYIGNPLLTDKHMYGYNVATSSEESTKTIAGACVSETPTADCAKIGDGYARITYLGQ